MASGKVRQPRDKAADKPAIPCLGDFIRAQIGHARWYTGPRRRPALERRSGQVFLSRAVLAEIKRHYAETFGLDPVTGQAVTGQALIGLTLRGSGALSERSC